MSKLETSLEIKLSDSDYYKTLLTCVAACKSIYAEQTLKELNKAENEEDLNYRLNELNYKIQEAAVSQEIKIESFKSDKLDTKYMVCYEIGKLLIVAVRGSQNLKDFLIDSQIIGYTIDNLPGEFHYGFSKRCLEIPIDYFVEKLLNDDYNIIFTGHSLGGAVAALLTCRLLFHEKVFNDPKLHKKVLCIGFGTPHFADKAFKEAAAKFERNFHFYVHEEDAVVYLLDHIRFKGITKLLSQLFGGYGYSADTNFESVDNYEEFKEFYDLLESIKDENQNEENEYSSSTSYIIPPLFPAPESVPIPEIAPVPLPIPASVIPRLGLPNYQHLGRFIYLKGGRDYEVSEYKFDILRGRAVSDHYMINYMKALTAIYEGESMKIRNPNSIRVNDFSDLHLPEAKKIQKSSDIGSSCQDPKNWNKYAVRIKKNSALLSLFDSWKSSDVHFSLCCQNAEYIIDASLVVSNEDSDPISYATREKPCTNSLLLKYKVGNSYLFNKQGGELKLSKLKLLIITHFEQKFSFEFDVSDKDCSAEAPIESYAIAKTEEMIGYGAIAPGKEVADYKMKRVSILNRDETKEIRVFLTNDVQRCHKEDPKRFDIFDSLESLNWKATQEFQIASPQFKPYSRPQFTFQNFDQMLTVKDTVFTL